MMRMRTTMVAKSVTEMVGKLRLNVRMEVGAFLVCIPTIQLQNCIYKLEGIKQTKITIFGQWLWLKADSHELHASAADGCVAAAEIGNVIFFVRTLLPQPHASNVARMNQPSDGKVVASNTRGPRFEFRHRHSFLSNIVYDQLY